MNPTWLDARRQALGLALSLAACALPAAAARAAEAPDFAREVQPILAAHCYECHGPEKQESGLRLDGGAALLAGGNSGAAVAAGKSAESLLIKALRGNDESVSKMPPEGPALSAEEIAAVARWIDAGARVPAEPAANARRKTSDHWSFQPLASAAPPAVSNAIWGRNPIDAFVLARLEAAGLAPSPPADKATLIRRLSIDLLGLPPSVAEVDAFVADTSGDAYERLVDRLLNSPHYGERWARQWLDIARYADSNGYTIDGGRSIWKYRDWVIQALNRDLPFDQFGIEQLAGDMLADARVDQRIATGFHRNTLVNEEGGTDKEQFRVEAVVDRVATTGSAFLGLTLGCARCHDHKYDPISQREFYELFALFNNADEPTLPVPTDQQAKEMPALLAEIKQSEERLAMVDANIGGRQSEWEGKFAGRLSVEWTVLDAAATSGTTSLAKLADGSLLADATAGDDTYVATAPLPERPVTAIMLEALPHESLPGKGPGTGDKGAFALRELSATVAAPNAEPGKLALAEAQADAASAAGLAPQAIDGNAKTAWTVNQAEQLGVPRTAIFLLAAEVAAAPGQTLSITLSQGPLKRPARLGRFRLAVTSAPLDVLRLPVLVRGALQKPAAARTAEEQKAVRETYQVIDPERVPLAAQIAELYERKKQIESATTTTLVMRERKEPRETHIHLRGDFLRAGAKVAPDVPEVLPPLVPRGPQPDRLDFARWLFRPDHPLTARVTANRVWQAYFGQGLVATENDFGLQGDKPTHPELLDWLARAFLESGWSQKALHRLIVTSATYRQASAARADLAKADPYNKLLGRQQRLRLEAETIRDTALAAAGLLNHDLGGPGVYPPQPEGIYRFTQQKKYWGESKGPDRFRRGMYTYLWRSSPYPFLKTFDAPDATVACTRRPRSNTPLQALTLANDRAFFEIAQGFAAELLAEPAADDTARTRLAFRRCLARDPAAEELSTLTEYVRAERQRFAESPADATAVAAAQPAGADAANAAAWTMLARVLLNLDEFITRE
ncbi:MAG: PSD1 and planctomycete cytochrome C domain-containing protein [Pirellulales bacterium]